MPPQKPPFSFVSLPQTPMGWSLLILNVVALIMIGAGLFQTIAFFRFHENLIYPGVSINGIPVGSLSQDMALNALETDSPSLPTYTIVITSDTDHVSSSAAQLGLKYQHDHAIETAFQLGRQGSRWQRFKQVVMLQFKPRSLTSPQALSGDSVRNLIGTLKTKLDTPGSTPSATLATSGNEATLSINPGQRGQAVDVEQTHQNLLRIFADTHQTPLTETTRSETDSALPQTLPDLMVPIVITTANLELTPEQVVAAQQRATKFVGKSAVFKGDDVTLRLNDQQLIALLAFPEGVNEAALNELMTHWEKQVTREPQNAEFTYDPTTLKVTTFVPHRNGLKLDETKTREQLISVINKVESTPVELDPAAAQTVFEETIAMTVKAPERSLAETNNLGIDEVIGVGDSEYAHSIASRVHNVNLAAQRINHVIVKPGEEFSFNKTIGEVTQATGYQSAYVILNGQTVLGDGGGVCQVSTTLFRSILNAGLKVTRRLPHSYRVSYYELNSKPGADATVYTGEVDLRFINDTPNHILIRTVVDNQRLAMRVEIYGTSDGRTTEIVDHKTWGYTPPPPAEYIPTPTLPTGQLKQVDWPASGIKASFKNIIRDKDGKVIREDVYNSNYRAWSAKYLRGI
jgi:vancomycin resistance protein YoaR